MFQRVWDYDCSNGTIAIGWGCGEVPDLPRSELEFYIEEKFLAREWNLRDRHQWLKFMHDIRPGDRVIARGGRKRVVGIGFVTGKASFDEQRALERAGDVHFCASENFLPVKWESLNNLDFARQVFGMQTVTEMSQERFDELFGTFEADGGQQTADESGSSFAPEMHLEEFLVANFDKVFGGTLSLILEDELKGRQYPTDIGIIDLLARDPSSNSYVVIELKRNRASDRVVGQILRYMGWVKEFLCQEGEGVRGIIICKDPDEKLDYALSMTPSIEVKYYRVDFQLLESPS